MRIGIFTRGKHTHSHKYEMAFGEGLRKHDLDYRLQTVGDRPRDLDLAILWGAHNQDLLNHFKAWNIDYITLERGFIGDREEWTSCGYNGLNGHADFLPEYADDKRRPFENEYLSPIRESKGSYILIMGQLWNDAAVKHIGFNDWLQNTYDELKKETTRKILYRPHPLDMSPFIPEGLEVIVGDLHDAMKKAHTVITLNSNSGVDAVLAGIPCIAMDKGSMVHDITRNDIADINNPLDVDREQWLDKMLYCQWLIEELEDGTAWEHLRKKFKS